MDDLRASLQCAVVVFAAASILVPLIRKGQVKKAQKAFQDGVTSEKFVKTCRSLKRYFRLDHAKDAYNLYGCYLCDVYLQRGEMAEFFKEMNCLKDVSATTKAYVYLLFIAYFREVPLRDLIAKYREFRDTGESALAIENETRAVWAVMSAYPPSETYGEKTELYRASVQNTYALDCLQLFLEEWTAG